MGKWILGIFGTVIAGLLLAYSTDMLGLGDKGGAGEGATIGGTVPPDPDPDKDPSKDEPIVMGPLEIGTNRQGNDFDAFGKPAGNAELCAEMCRADSNCDAMTYVKSTGICWLKNGVPAASADEDMVSAKKVR